MKAAFLCAMQFLTRLPIKTIDNVTPSTLGRSVLFYPLVGLVIGAILYATHYLLSAIDSGLQAAIILTLWVFLTGALHIDGLADLVDAWVGAHGDRDRMMEIMKDATSGPIAVTAIVLLLLIKFAALSAMIQQNLMIALLLIPLIGRAGLLAALRFIPYVRPKGLGALLVENLPDAMAVRVLWASALLVVLLLGWPGVGVLVACWGCYFFMASAIKKALGGITGDCAGALCEVLECIAVVAVVVFA